MCTRKIKLTAVIFVLLAVGCTGLLPAEHPDVCREASLPRDIAKRGPDTDHHPPILHCNDYEEPVPLPCPINTSGAEDSPFILPDGNTLYWFFTPDVRLSPAQQFAAGDTGIYVSHRVGHSWSEPRRVWLIEPGRKSMEGAVCIQGNEMWFASVREGYDGVNMFTAELVDGIPVNWEYVGDRLMKEIQIGEVHIHGDDLYFHSDRPGGLGSLDIWVTTRDGDCWSDPINVTAVNSAGPDGFPCISPDGTELWFTRTHLGTPAVFRSTRTAEGWGEPELIISQFAGEPTVDRYGNVYFVHHFFEHGEMIEADIYVAYRKR